MRRIVLLLLSVLSITSRAAYAAPDVDAPAAPLFWRIAAYIVIALLIAYLVYIALRGGSSASADGTRIKDKDAYDPALASTGKLGLKGQREKRKERKTDDGE